MLVEHANKMWCPFVRHRGRNCDPQNGRNPSYARCIGPECMMWSWTVDGQAGRCGLNIDGATVVTYTSMYS